MSGEPTAVILTFLDFPSPSGGGQGGGTSFPSPCAIAIIGERRLGVAALASLLLNQSGYQFVEEARGTSNVRHAVEAHQPAVVIQSVEDPALLPAGPSFIT